MIKVGIVGVSGYSGMTALELLLKHPDVRVTYVSANNTAGKVSEIWPRFAGQTGLYCGKFDFKEAALCDCVLLALPHTVAMSLVPKLLKNNGVRVIDLSGDYRLRANADYKKWYNADHLDRINLKKAVYGLPELYREDIRKARLISNPGCYPTAALLALAPVAAIHPAWLNEIVIDAKSGVSGAGRQASVALNYCEVNENFKAYKVLNHQHVPEIELYLKRCAAKDVRVQFVPHLLPVNRGILETIYIRLPRKIGQSRIRQLYERFYKTEPFVRILKAGEQPELKHVVRTNFCDIALAMSSDEQWLVITAAIDNLVKGAAGQAVQNLNIMFNLNESEALL
jgi:N-acetyl-gamma-glutamyl-phosphate reductase